jgi:hypothetical protein
MAGGERGTQAERKIRTAREAIWPCRVVPATDSGRKKTFAEFDPKLRI